MRTVFGRVWRGPVSTRVPVPARPGAMPRFPNVEEGATFQSEASGRQATEGSRLRGVDSSRGIDKALHRHAQKI